MNIPDRLGIYRGILTALFALFLVVVGLAALFRHWLGLSVDQMLTIVGDYFVFCGALLVLFQINLSLAFERRKEAAEFLFHVAEEKLVPKASELKELLEKPYLLFGPGEDLQRLLAGGDRTTAEKERLGALVLELLNFYERMAIGIFKHVYDEDMCYDDQGLIAVSFWKWSRAHIADLQSRTNPRAFVNFAKLAERWHGRLRRERGEPRIVRGTNIFEG